MEDNVEETSDNYFIDGYTNAGSYTQDALRAILSATKAGNDLPSPGDDFDYYCEFPVFRKAMTQQKQKILQLMTKLIQSQGIKERFQTREADEQFDLLVNANDVIFENSSNYLDEASGFKKPDDELVIAVKPIAINTSWNKKQFISPHHHSCRLLTAKNISRPQLSFKDKIDNGNSAFVPIIKEKPNSIKPLAITLESDGDREEYCHPYEWEIEKFEPSENMLEEVEPVLPKSLEETPFEYVVSVEQLRKMCLALKSEKEFAVDLEHHSYRSFQGFTCLMQISTRTKDYVIDTLELRSDLYILNEVFTDSKIVKVLHGANMDVQWLQRDFGIYIVNLFDTGQAARVLHFAHLSLSYLLKHYCKVEVDKQFQLADWRIRPLPPQMLKYAREDTHYLLYVYDCMKNDLIKSSNMQKNLLLSVYSLSKIICAKKYEKPFFHEEKYTELYKRSKKTLNAKQLYCFKELYAWRDRTARENDESLAYVLPDHMLFQISEILPREQQGILACCNPIPPLVKQQLNELHAIILKANEMSLKQLETLELEQKTRNSKGNVFTIDLNSLIHCPHDIHHLEDKVSQNISSSADHVVPNLKESKGTSLLKDKPLLSIFAGKIKEQNNVLNFQNKTERITEMMKKLISPYERYKVTEKLQLENKEKKKLEEDAVEKEKDDVIEEEIVPIYEGPKETIEPEIIDIDVEERIENLLKPYASTTVTEQETDLTPLRKKKNKKRKKPDPDISLNTADGQPAKKSPKTNQGEALQPYSYDPSEFDRHFGKKTEHHKKKQERQPGSQLRLNIKRKHANRAICGEGSTSKGRPNWPKNK